MSAIFKKKVKKAGGVLDLSDQDEAPAQEAKQDDTQRRPAAISKPSVISFDSDEVHDIEASKVNNLKSGRMGPILNDVTNRKKRKVTTIHTVPRMKIDL
jgi:hypothetical protein